MISYFFLVFGIALFGYSVFLFRNSKSDRAGLKVYGLTAYVALAITAIAFGTIIAPRLTSFGISHVLLCVAIWKAAATFLLKPGFKSFKMCDGDKDEPS